MKHFKILLALLIAFLAMAMTQDPYKGWIRYETQIRPIQIIKFLTTGENQVKLVVSDGIGGVKLITNAYNRDSTILYTKLNRHLVNDLDTVKTNELITNFVIENDSAKITEAGVIWKAKLPVNPYIADSSYIKNHIRNDLDIDPTNELQDTTQIPGLAKFVYDHTYTIKGDTGVNGLDGKSAYEIAVINGFIGDVSAWLASLVGADGAQGIQGVKGDTGDTGPQGIQGPAGIDGADGKTAYQTAVDNGFTGTEQEWLLSLECTTGTVSLDSVTSGIPIKYGDLYNYWTATSSKKIAAPGWHVPTIAEVDSLAAYVGGPDSSPGINDTAGGYLKQAGTYQWDAPNTGATNSSGFNGVGTGIRSLDGEYGYYHFLNQHFAFWTTTANVPSFLGFQRVMVHTTAAFNRNYSALNNGHPIRLIKDDTTYVSQYVGNDLKVYNTIKIGKQIWLSQNLAESRFRDGSLIPTGINGVLFTNAQWTALRSPGRCFYNDDETVSGGTVNLVSALNDLKNQTSSIIDSLSLYPKRSELADSLSNYWNKTEITPADTTRWGSSSGSSTPNTSAHFDPTTKIFSIVDSNGTVGDTISITGGNCDPSKFSAIVFVDTQGNDATGLVGDNSKPFLTINAALDALGANGGIVQIGKGEFAAPSQSKMRNNLWFKGSGKPMPDWTITTSGTDIVTISQPTKLIGGTIIHGTWFFIPSANLTGNIKITDLGIDVGNYWCTNSNGGIAVDGLLFAQKYNISGGQSANDGIHTLQSDSPPLYGVVVNNVISLCKSNSSGIHGNLFENVINPAIENVTGVGGSFGIVIKSIGGNFRNLQSYGCSNTGLYIKADDYANCKDAVIDGFYYRNMTGITTLYGIIFETFEYSLNNINISNFAINGVTSGIFFSQSASFPNNTISNCRLYAGFITGVQTGIYTTAVKASGIVFDRINIKSATGDAIYSRTLGIDNNTYSNIVISGSGGDGFDVSATTNLFLNDCTVTSSSGYDYNFSSNIVGTNLQGTTFNGTLKSVSAKYSSIHSTYVTNTAAGNVTATNVQSAINELDSEKQATLVSGTTIKTINSTSLLGAGDISIPVGISDATADSKTYGRNNNAWVEVGAGGGISDAPNDSKLYGRQNATWVEVTGGAEYKIWTVKTGSYVTSTTFTFSGTDADAKLVEMSLFTCTNSTGSTRRIGYVKTATNSSGTITCNVVTDTDLASGDKDFKIAYNRKATDYMRLVTIPGEQIADASYSQGLFYADIPTASYLLPVDLSVQTAAVGTGAALTVNIYKNTTALFSSAPDMTTNTVLRSQRPTTNTISAAETVSLRIMSSAGATNKASDFQAKLYIIPQSIFTSF